MYNHACPCQYQNGFAPPNFAVGQVFEPPSPPTVVQQPLTLSAPPAPIVESVTQEPSPTVVEMLLKVRENMAELRQDTST